MLIFLAVARQTAMQLVFMFIFRVKITKRKLKVNKRMFVQNKKIKISSFIPIYNNIVFLGRLN